MLPVTNYQRNSLIALGCLTVVRFLLSDQQVHDSFGQWSSVQQKADQHESDDFLFLFYASSDEEDNGSHWDEFDDEENAGEPPIEVNQPCPLEPCDLSIVFMGDSLTRFQYFSLAYFLRHGQWLDPATKPNLIHPSTFLGWGSELNYEWTPWFKASTLSLAPYENCDCYREAGLLNGHKGKLPFICENRYFYDPRRRNRITYLLAYGTATTIRGHWAAQNATQQLMDFYTAHTQQDLEDAFNSNSTNRATPEIGVTVGPIRARVPYLWEGTWMEALRGHVADLDPDVVVINAGIWDNTFGETSFRAQIVEAIHDMNPPERNRTVLWKTTTAARGGSYRSHETDSAMCQLLQGCLNVTWTTSVPKSLYVDQGHFLEPVYRILNEQLLAQLQATIPTEVSSVGLGNITWFPPVPVPGLFRGNGTAATG